MSDTPSEDTAAFMPKQYPCPRCGTLTPWQNNPNKPFCSKRCKLIDLGAWANEDYKIATQDTPFSAELDD